MKKTRKLFSFFLMLFFVLAIVNPFNALAEQGPYTSTPDNPKDSLLRDGSHDFDFNFGNWRTTIKRLLHPFTDSSSWVELNGTVRVHKIWNGVAQLEEIEAEGLIGHFEGTTLFLYNPAAHQWSQNFASSSNGDISNPTIGEFKNGSGELFTQETLRGRAVMVRGVWSDIMPDSHSYSEYLSDDGGKTWIPAFISHLTRDNSAPVIPGSSAGQHDFDFAFGKWKERSSRLLHPLTGSTTWIEMNGISVVTKLLNGGGNMTELSTDGPNGHLELLALRLYNPQTHQWYLTFATSKVGVLGMPQTIGEFRNGHGEFYDQEEYNGRTIWVRFTITPLTPDTYRSEQAFSNDGGKTWETNWINNYTRTSN